MINSCILVVLIMGQFYNSIVDRLKTDVAALYSKAYSFLDRFDVKGIWKYTPLREKHKSLEAELRRVNNRYRGNIQQKTKEIESQYNEKLQKAILEERERILKERERHVKGLESRLAEIQQRFGATKRKYTHLEDLYLEKKGRVVELEVQIAAYQGHLKGLEGQAKEQTNYMHMYAAAVEQIEALNQQISEQDGMTLKLREELQTERGRLAKLDRAYQKQDFIITAGKKEAGDLRKKIGEYQSHLRGLRKYQELYKTAIAEIEALQQVLSRRNEQISRLTKDLQAAQRVAEPESGHEEDTPTLTERVYE